MLMKTRPTESLAAANHSADAVAQYLKEQIKFGVIGGGHRLIEIDVMNATGASRGRVREAFKQLAAEGFVQIEEFKGASIKKLSRQEVTEMYQLRALLESFAIRLTAQTKLSSAQKTELKQLQAAMDKAEKTMQHDQFRKLNDDYHLFIRNASGNRLLKEHLERLRLPLLLVQFHRYFDAKELTAANNDHRLMTKAILDGDAATGEKIMQRHVTDGLTVIVGLDDRFFS
jgi:DNA-binding GntR family transcriptional regulator